MSVAPRAQEVTFELDWPLRFAGMLRMLSLEIDLLRLLLRSHLGLRSCPFRASCLISRRHPRAPLSASKRICRYLTLLPH